MYFVEKGFCHSVQAGFEILGSSPPLTLTSQRAGITGASHHIQPYLQLTPRLECSGGIYAYCNLCLSRSSSSPAPSSARGLQAPITHAQLIFVCLVDKGFHHVGQAGLELLTSGDLPTLASRSAGMT
ncbi:LOW QUALITY PROTEIN: hypothetical protein AAY473_014261, partial [Plecturocebus cupreus]